jgi:ABC-type dipeptide/oligopeptide/nickel transport system permease subunit
VAIAVGISSLPTVVRQVRAAFVSESAKDYVLAARATGAGQWRIAALEILPNCAWLILVLTTLTFGGAVLEAAGLSFLGLSGQPDIPEWGMMLREEQGTCRIAPWLCIAPGWRSRGPCWPSTCSVTACANADGELRWQQFNS